MNDLQSKLYRLKQGCILACHAETEAMLLPINLGKDVTFYILNVDKVTQESINRISKTLADKYADRLVSQLDVIKLFQALTTIIAQYNWLIAKETLKCAESEN